MFKNFNPFGIIGKDLFFLPQCHSTNDLAKQLIKENKFTNGQIIITSHQTAGRGQRGNTWLTEPNQNLTFSIILESKELTNSEMFDVNMAVSVGLLNSINSILKPEKILLKWPNDIIWNRKKLGGILIENIYQNDKKQILVVGIGLNINQKDFKYLNATSLNLIQNQEFDLQNVLEQCCKSINESLSVKNNLRKTYLENLLGYKQKLTYKTEDEIFEGSIIDLTDEGKIKVQTPFGVKIFDKKEIKLI
ncbi:MAG: biotin--[acetyl-CoA-carboxylase] ligase [Bacteroidota bacterium]|nr:biotin--[acetyl-CoA-carboxylase] ligase [Bacteroidota bacterium]